MGLHLPFSDVSGMKTPVYYYDLALLDETISKCLAAAENKNYHIHYALKANFNERLLSRMLHFGLGADCVSGNEVRKALEIGFKPGKIVFAGVGKSDDELVHALKAGISCFNCESLQELEVIGNIAKGLGLKAPVALRINPNVNANTHKYITTGLNDNKFGINLSDFTELISIFRTTESLEFKGIHFHVGSQITDFEVFKNLCIRVNEIRAKFQAANFDVKSVNVGGGLGIDYSHPDLNPIPDFNNYFEIFDQYLERSPGDEIHFELGRSLVGQCGNLLSRVLFIKKGTTNFAILDAGMTELIRPALYQAYHQIENLTKFENPFTEVYDVVGPVCETSDTFRKAVDLPVTQRGDLIAIRSAGAYGEVMASAYNLRDRVGSLYSTDQLSV